jgi:hypothetical protein
MAGQAALWQTGAGRRGSVGVHFIANPVTGEYGLAKWMPNPNDNSVKRQYGFSEKDNISVMKVSKAIVDKVGSGFVWKPMTMKARSLQQKKYLLKGRITSAQYANLPPKEREKKLARLRCELKYVDCMLNSEVDATPYTGVIVHSDEEQE